MNDTSKRRRRLWAAAVGATTLLAVAAGTIFLRGCASPFARARDSVTPHSTGPAAVFDYSVLPSMGARQGQRSVRLDAAASLASRGQEELWVVARPPSGPTPTDDAIPGTGALMAKRPGQDKDVPLPLAHTDVRAAIAAYVASVTVTQHYRNPYDEKIEAVYVFPLPSDAAVSEFIMTIGERRIRGIIREREEAKRIYEEARAQGYVASLLTQERPNIFTQSVANIEPGKALDVEIQYFHTLAYLDNAYEFVFPMVVGPRFNPPGSTSGVGAVGRENRGRSGQPTEVSYLRPGERSGHDIALAVNIDAGVSIESIESPSHVVDVTQPAPERAAVTLRATDSIPNKDFVLRYKLAGDRVKAAVLTHRDAKGGYFTLLLCPPEHLKSLARRPAELVFVLDCSGSMSGEPITQAKAMVRRALARLGPDDTFQIVQFSSKASHFGPSPVAATPDNVKRAMRHLDNLAGEGGTMMIEGIRAALAFPHDPRRLRIVSFLTDGFIGDETEILAEVERTIGDSRIFSVGIGSSPNRYLIEGLARIGRGAVAYVGPGDSATAVADAFYERVQHPALTDVEIDWGAMHVKDVYPGRMPDLFVGRPVVLTGRFDGEGRATIKIHGRAGDTPAAITVEADLDDKGAAHAAISRIWARAHIADLADRMLTSNDAKLDGQIRQVALEHGLMSAFTSFVAVDSQTRTEGDHGTSVHVAVPVPQGTRYETTVDERPVGVTHTEEQQR